MNAIMFTVKFDGVKSNSFLHLYDFMLFSGFYLFSALKFIVVNHITRECKSICMLTIYIGIYLQFISILLLVCLFHCFQIIEQQN